MDHIFECYDCKRLHVESGQLFQSEHRMLLHGWARLDDTEWICPSCIDEMDRHDYEWIAPKDEDCPDCEKGQSHRLKQWYDKR